MDGCNSGNFFFSSRKLKHFLLQPQPMLAERVLQSRGFLFCSGEVPLSTLQLSPPVLFCIRRCCAAGPDRSQRAAGFGGAQSSVAASHVQVGGGQLCCACSCAVPAALLCLQLSHALPAAEGRAAVTAVLPVQAMQSTPNYLWSTDDLLGQGATACVYKARSKVRGAGGTDIRPPQGNQTPVPSCSVSTRAALALFLFSPLWLYGIQASFGASSALCTMQCCSPSIRVWGGECLKFCKPPTTAICMLHANARQRWDGDSQPCCSVIFVQ